MFDLALVIMHFVALLVEVLLVVYCIACFQKMRILNIHTTFMKPVLVFGLIILGARISEMLGDFMQLPHLILVECAVIVVAFSILTYGIYDYNRMLLQQVRKKIGKSSGS
jgi:hypothetical protein